MKNRFKHLVRAVLMAVCYAAPAFAYTDSGVGDRSDPAVDIPGLSVTRHALPALDVITAKPTAPAPPQATPGDSANPLWAIPLSALAATRDRPLFTPSRRRPMPVVANAPMVAPPPAAPEHLNLVLVGTMVRESEGIAVFTDQSTSSTIRLRTGEGHNGWILKSVARSVAILQKGDQSEKLQLPKLTPPR